MSASDGGARDSEDALVAAALAARENAYAPYSRFRVGAAIESDDGRVFIGCNVENASYGVTRCAEQVAITHAVSQGVRAFVRIAIATHAEPPAGPCGVCRQMMVEFCDDLEIILVNPDGQRRRARLVDLLPEAFRPVDLHAAQARED